MKRRRPVFVGASSRAVERPFKRPRQTAQVAEFQRMRRRQLLAPRIGGFTGIEKKFVDFFKQVDAFSLTWAGGEMDPGTADALSAIAQGDGESQRDGRVAVLHSVFIKGFLSIAAIESSAAPLDDIVVRLAIVQDKQTNGAQLNAEDVFKTLASGDDTNSVKNLQNSARFIVLKDKTWLIPRARAVSNEGAANLFSSPRILVPIKMGTTFRKPIRVNHTGTTAVIASVADNSIHLIGCATNASALLSYSTRIRFTG